MGCNYTVAATILILDSNAPSEEKRLDANNCFFDDTGDCFFCGLIADLSVVPWVRYFWYINGVIAFLVGLGGIWGHLRAKTRSQGVELSSFYDRIKTYFTVLWICYPTVWILRPSGFEVFNQTVDTFLFCLIPFFSKVGFSFLDLHGLGNLSSSSPTRVDSAVGNALHFLGTITTSLRQRRLPSRNKA